MMHIVATCTYVCAWFNMLESNGRCRLRQNCPGTKECDIYGLTSSLRDNNCMAQYFSVCTNTTTMYSDVRMKQVVNGWNHNAIQYDRRYPL